MSQELLLKDGINEVNGKNELSLQIDNERLKHFFYMLHGEPTTRTRALHGAVLVSKSDIDGLVKKLKEQLTLVHVTDATFTISVGFDKDFIEKPFDEFTTNEWLEPDKTKEVIVRVHFMYEDINKGSSIKNSLFIRIAKGIKPGNILQMLASSDMDGLEKIEDLMCPVFCRTDNVHDKLSKDLLGVVEDWHSGQKQPNLISGTYKFLKKHKSKVAKLAHYITPTSVVFILCYMAFVTAELVPEQQQFPVYVSIIVASKLLLSFFLSYGHSKGKEIYSRLSNISHEDVVFDITKGDDKEYSEVLNKNKELFSSARNTFLWVNIQAVVASLVAAAIFEFIKP
ncbi:hypothetical protein [Pseudoalteromonas sp. MTN2-4]|uniref:hypothetical protein n=1 Tax=Pseudoalteromonas sp. MTN2-4 TaxID=3056555 RepID=UPI0036F3F29F